MKESNIFLEEIVNLSDPLKSVDNLSEPNSPILSIYGRGKSFKISDESNLFDVIKIVKSYADRHPFVSSMRYDIKMKDRYLEFYLNVEPNRRDYIYGLETIASRMKETIERRYDNISVWYDIIDINNKNKIQLLLKVEEHKN